MNDANDPTDLPAPNTLQSLVEWTRRSFLKYVGSAAAAGAIPSVLSSCSETTDAAGPASPDVNSKEAAYVGPTGEAVVASYVINRASDGFDMQMDLMNLQVKSGQLVQVTSSLPSYIVLRTHPQHVSECVSSLYSQYYPPGTTNILESWPVNYQGTMTYASAPSRLVFAIAPGFQGVAFKLNAILSLLSNCPVNVAANALSDAAIAANPVATVPAAAAAWSSSYNGAVGPDPTVTSIEMPFRLEISPNELSRFVHSNPPSSLPSSGRVELANSRLAVVGANGLPDEVTRANRTVRALYTRDWNNTGTNPTAPGQGTLDPYPTQAATAAYSADAGIDALPYYIRQLIVQQTAEFSYAFGPQPTSVPVDALLLTPYGGTLQAKGAWSGQTLQTWKHDASIGRDDFVQATLVGYLLPFGLRAIVTMTVQRELDVWRNPFAALQANWVLHLIDTSADFDNIAGLPTVGNRAMPFKHVAAHQSSFVIDAPAVSGTVTDANGVQTANISFAVTQSGAQLMLPMTATDRRGKNIKFSIPLYWTALSSLSGGIANYNAPAAPTTAGPAPSAQPINLIALNRQRIALAPSTRDHTTVEVDWMTFNAWAITPTVGGPTVFCPRVVQISGVAEATRALGHAGDQPTIMNYHGSYAPAVSASTYNSPTVAGAGETVSNGATQPAATQVLVTFGNTVGAQFPSAKAAGGLAVPNASFQAIGMVNGLANNANDVLPATPGGSTPPMPSWSQLLAGAKLFGEIDLGQLAEACGLGKAPKFIAEAYTTVERYAAELEQLLNILNELSSALGTVSTVVTQITTAFNDVTNILQNLPSATPQMVQGIVSDISTLTNVVQPGQGLDAALASLGTPYSGIARLARSQLQKVASAVNVGGTAIQAAIQAMQAGAELARDQKAKIDWVTPIKAGIGVPSSSVPLITTGDPQGTNGSTLTLSVELNGQATDASQALKLFCSFDNFTLNFPPISQPWLQLNFDRIFFSQQPGQKTEIDVVFNGINFLQCLQWIEVIESLIPSDGFSDPPYVNVTESGIDAGFSAGLPSICAGMLSFENMKLSADLNVPFIGSAITFTFAFCDKDHPFTVTVSFLGGGGYFTITLASSGTSLAIQSLEGSFSVCAQLAIDIVIASGSLSARAGVTVSYDQSTGVSLTAFVDLRGALDILGLIQASIEAYLGLTYDFGTNSLTGECKLILSIEVFGLGKSVTLDFKQTFAGSAPSNQPSTQDHFHAESIHHAESASGTAPAALPMPSPSFADLFTDPNPVAGQAPVQTRWNQYCSYFAAA